MWLGAKLGKPCELGSCDGSCDGIWECCVSCVSWEGSCDICDGTMSSDTIGSLGRYESPDSNEGDRGRPPVPAPLPVPVLPGTAAGAAERSCSSKSPAAGPLPVDAAAARGSGCSGSGGGRGRGRGSGGGGGMRPWAGTAVRGERRGEKASLSLLLHTPIGETAPEKEAIGAEAASAAAEKAPRLSPDG